MHASDAAEGVHTFMRWLLSAARCGMMSSRPPPSFRRRPCSALRPDRDDGSAVSCRRHQTDHKQLRARGTRHTYSEQTHCGIVCQRQSGVPARRSKPGERIRARRRLQQSITRIVLAMNRLCTEPVLQMPAWVGLLASVAVHGVGVRPHVTERWSQTSPSGRMHAYTMHRSSRDRD